MFGLPRALIPIYTIVFIDVLGLTILIPLLPGLASALHTSAAVIGAALSTTAVCATISSPLWGGLSDRIGRKRVLQISQCFSLAGYVLLAFAGNLPLLFVSRAVEGFGGGNLGVAQSYIADVTEERDREKAFAFAAATFGLGFVLGPVMAGLLVRAGLAVPFLVAAALQLANIVLTWRFLHERSQTSGGPAKRTATQKRDLLAILRRPNMLNLLGRQLFYIFSFTYFFTVFALYLQRELGFGPARSSLLLGLAGLIGAAAQIFLVDALDKKFGDKRLSQASFAIGFVAYAGLAFVNGNVWIFVAILFPWALSGSFLRPTLSKLIAAAAPERQRGAILGFADSLDNASMIFAPAAAGTILGASPAAIGILPALALAAAFVLGCYATDDRVPEATAA